MGVEASESEAVLAMPDDPNEAGSNDPRDERRDYQRDYQRDLGVIEAITYVTRSCPSGVVVAAAERALEEIKQGGPDALRQQAYFVLTALKGWRGERAAQVHRSLTKYLADQEH